MKIDAWICIGVFIKSRDVFFISEGQIEKKPGIRYIKGTGEDDGHWNVVYNQRRLTRLGRDVITGLLGLPLGIIGYAIISTFIR